MENDIHEQHVFSRRDEYCAVASERGGDRLGRGIGMGHALTRLTNAEYLTLSLRPNSIDRARYRRHGELSSYTTFVAVSRRCAGWLR